MNENYLEASVASLSLLQSLVALLAVYSSFHVKIVHHDILEEEEEEEEEELYYQNV